MRCGLVVLNYNDFATTEKLLNAIKNYDELEKIIVVDNKSTDNSFKKLLKFQNDKISVIQSPKNGGYSYGNNVGIKYLISLPEKYDIIGIANPDVYFDNDFVKNIKQLFSERPDYAMITGLQLNSDGKIADNLFWPIPTAYDFLCSSTVSALKKIFTLGFYKPLDAKEEWCKAKLSEGLKNGFVEVEAVGGSLFFVRREDFEAINFFDENIFMYHEETILGAKLKKLGRKVGVSTKISYKHFHYASSDFYTSKDFWTIYKRKTAGTRAKLYVFTHYITDNKILKAVYCLKVMLFYAKTFLLIYPDMLFKRIKKFFKHDKI